MSKLTPPFPSHRDRKQFYKKLTGLVAEQLSSFMKDMGYSAADISRKTNVPQARISEILNYKEGQTRTISAQIFMMISDARIIDPQKIRGSLTDRERFYFDDDRLILTPGIIERLLMLKKQGDDPVKVLDGLNGLAGKNRRP